MSQPRLVILALQLPGKHDGKGYLVHLQTTTNRATVDPGVLRKTTIRLLLNFEEIIKRAISAGAIAYGQERRPDLIKIACPDGMIAADYWLISVWPAAPGN